MDSEEGLESNNDAQDLSPVPLTEDIKILGITFDRHFTFDSHIEGLIAKARLRRGVLARAPHTK